MSFERAVTSGLTLKEAQNVLIMLHGRGATARDIIALQSSLVVDRFHLIAPPANRHSWYPYSFMAPVELNQPYLDHSLTILTDLVASVSNAGLTHSQIYILGFSQGACLALEFAARNATHYGGIIAFTGGLIGEQINKQLYKGNLDKTRIFIGNSDVDPHVPALRSAESGQVLKALGADVTHTLYPGMAHTICSAEIDFVNECMLQ